MTEVVLRFLLDQQFPKAPFEVQELDRSVAYEHLSDYVPQFSRTSTPDWMLHLIAAEGGFDGVVTIDAAQLTEETELMALALSGVSVVTWKGGEEDPVVLWGQLLAYMPQVAKELRMTSPIVVILPNPRLQRHDHIFKPGELARAMKRRDGTSFEERRARSVHLMTAELRKRDLSHLERHLQGKRRVHSKPDSGRQEPAVVVSDLLQVLDLSTDPGSS